MLNHDPDQRPSANTLLESNIIPIEQKEQFEQLLDTMFDSQNDKLQSRYYEKTIRKLFQRKNPIALDATFDTDLQLDFNHVRTNVKNKKKIECLFLFACVSWQFYIEILKSTRIYVIVSFVFVKNTAHFLFVCLYSFLIHRSTINLNFQH